jgi:hypothetical protein
MVMVVKVVMMMNIGSRLPDPPIHQFFSLGHDLPGGSPH